MKHENDFQVSLPYAGTSGWSGTDTSEQRAVTADNSGETSKRQSWVLFYLFSRGTDGATWKEVAEHFDWHHGVASGVLSVLHKDEQIARLLSKRDKCRVYVHPEYVSGRDTDTQGRKAKTCPNCGHSL